MFNDQPNQKFLWGVFAVVVLMFCLMTVSHVLAQSPEPTPIPITGENLENAVGTAANRLQDVIARLTQPPESNVMRLVMIVAGIALLAAGWRIYEYIIIIAGAIVGAAFATSLFASSSAAVNLLIMLAGGVIGALLSTFLYYIAVFIIGVHLGIVITNAIAVALSLTPVTTVALLIGGIIGGLILLGLSFEFLILVSAFVGGQMLSLALGLGITWTLIFALIGILIQYGLTRAYHYDFRRRHTTRRDWVRT